MAHSPQDITKQLKKTYRSIAKAFSDSRSAPWPEFKVFAEYIPDESKVLDLGCGNGRFYQYLIQDQKLKVDYTGVDFCPEFLEIAKKRYPKADFIESNITEIDLDQKFDCIVSIATFHHLPSAQLRKKALKKIFEHLEDDGVLLISVWNLWQWKYWKYHLESFWAWIISFFKSDLKGLMIPFGEKKLKRYYHAFFPLEMKRLLKHQSFQIEHFSVSRHNYLFVCRKRMAKATSDPVTVSSLKKSMKPSPIATASK